MPTENTKKQDFRIELKQPEATRLDLNLGEAINILMYGYSDMTFLNFDGKPLLIDWEQENHRLLLMRDGIYRLGIFPRPPSAVTVAWSDEEWKLIEADHAARTAGVDAENDRRWKAAKPRWEVNLKNARPQLATLDHTLRRSLQDGRGPFRSEEWLRHRDQFSDRLSLKRAIASMEKRIREGQTYVDPPELPPRQSPFARILKGPHKDDVTPEGYPCAHDYGLDCEDAAREAATWLRRHGRSESLQFHGVHSDELVVGPSDRMNRGLDRQRIPAERFIEDVDFDASSDRIHPFSSFDDSYSSNVETFAATLHASELQRRQQLQQRMNSWSNVTVDHQVFRTLVKELERSVEQKKKRSLADERRMAEHVAEQLRAKLISKKAEASNFLQLGIRDRRFERVWALATSLAGHKPRPGRPKGKTPHMAS